MARINCKSCGCPNEVETGKTTVICEACGTEQTIPNLDSEKKTNLFNRANAARLQCDFTKALANYEAILVDYPNDPEAHWGICLCRYGIEYVDDPKTKKKIPTCHRTVYNSIFDDIDYKEAINNSDVVSKKIYQDEAEKIDRIQKSIIAISQKEEPYDIFICYKETDEIGHRTRDSFVAEDIYTELINKDYKVFFSRITLESKLGLEFEPIIFAALQSAKVMLVISSKKEYFDAVWVKNEWSRYLEFMHENPGKKYMIPCYRDMEAYDMPDEFLNLQSQNLDRLGAKQDLIRAIDKVFGNDIGSRRDNDDEDDDHNRRENNLLKRVLILLEDNDFQKADDILEEILNEDAECAEAYAYKILVEKRLSKLEDLGTLTFPLTNDKNYQKVIRYADEDFKNLIMGYNKQIIAALHEKNKSGIYQAGMLAKSKGNYAEAINQFTKIKEYRDSKKQIEDCQENININIYNRAENFLKTLQYQKAIEEFSRIIDFKDSKQRIEECKTANNERIYNAAKNCKERNNFDVAITNFTKIIDYKDSKDQIEECKKLKDLYAKEIIYKNFTEKAIKFSSHDELNETGFNDAINKLKTIIGYKDTEEFINNYTNKFKEMANKIAIEKEQERLEKIRLEEERLQRLKEEAEEKARLAKIRKDKTIRGIKIASPFVILLMVLLILTFTLFIPMSKYNNAKDLLEEGNYDEAISILQETNFSDFKEQLKLAYAGQQLSRGAYETGIKYVFDIEGKVNVKYDGAGGTPAVLEETLTTTGKNKVDVTCSYDGYTFYGWTIKEYKINYDDYSIDLLLEASYKVIQYNLELNYNRKNNDVTNQKFDITDVINIPNPTREGYTFVGWTGTDLTEPTKNLVIKNTFGAKSYKANWLANEYTVTYVLNGGEGETTQKVTYHSQYVLDTPTKLGYSFVCWRDENGNIFEQDGTWSETKDITLYAQWVGIDYSITYYLADGNVYGNPNSYGITDEFTLINPTKEGYTFIGWSGTGLDGLQMNVIILPGSVGNKEYTANWQGNEYTITFDANGGNVSETSENVIFGDNTTLLVPTKEGYDFLGWYTEEDQLIEDGIWNITDDVNLTAKWEIIEYSIEYDLEEGEVEGNPSIYTVEDEITLINPTKVGYTFVGWTGTNIEVPQVTVTISIGSTGNREYVANFEANKYVITYDVNGGEDLISSTQDVYYDTEYELLTSTRVGYTFLGWYDENDILVEDGTWLLDQNVLLRAKWSANTYKVIYNDTLYVKNYVAVTFDFNHDSATDNVIELKNGEILEYPSVPQRAGYIFTGWYLEEECQNEYDFTADIVEDMTLYAGWIVTPYTITNNSYYSWGVNGDYLYSTNKVNNSSSTYKITATSALIISFKYATSSESGYDKLTISKNGSYLVGTSGINSYQSYSVNLNAGDYLTFTYSKDGSSSNGSDCAMIKDLKYINTKINSSTAVAKCNYANDQYENGIYYVENSVYETKVQYDDNYTLITPIRVGYTFVGWYDSNDQLIESGTWVIANDITLTPKWEKSVYNITYDLDGGIVEGNPTTYTIEDEITLVNPTKEGYTFVGWTGTNIEVPQEIATISIGSIGDREFTANFEAINYTITYDLDGGIVEGNPTTYTIEDEITLVNPTKVGYTFVGWIGTNIEVPQEIVTISIGNVGNKEFTANFEANEYTITYNVNDGDELENSTQKAFYDEEFELSIPTRIGYTFLGWYDENEELVESGIWTFTNDLVLTAKWEANEYTITYVNENGEYTLDVIYNTSYSLEKSNLANYDFIGYYTLEEGNGVQITDETGSSLDVYSYTEDIIVYACNTYTVNFVTNGGTKVDSVTLEKSELFEDIYVTEKKGLTFGGWYLEPECNTLVTYDISLGNKTLYAYWEEESKPNMFDYVVVDDTITIKGIVVGNEDSSIYIPSYIDGYVVTTLGESMLEGDTVVKELTIPDTITKISYNAFKDSSLSKVNYLGTIDTWSIISFENIDSNPIYYSKNLYIDNTLVDSIKIENVTKVSDYAFYGMSDITNIEIGNNVSSIGYAAFGGHSKLVSISIPFVGNSNILTEASSLSLFGYIFGSKSYKGSSKITQYYDESNYTDYYVPDTLRTIKVNGGDIYYGAFTNLTMITKLEVSSIISIDTDIIKNCNNLEYNVYENGNYLGDNINPYLILVNIINKETTEITIHNDTKFIMNNALENCTLATNIDVPENLVSIGRYAFNNCSSLIAIDLPTTIESMGYAAFSGCGKLESITIPFVGESRKTYADTYQRPLGYIFGTSSFTNSYTASQYYHGQSLDQTVYSNYCIPKSLTTVKVLDGEINYGAFYNCKYIKTIYLEENVYMVSDRAFRYCGITDLYIGKGIIELTSNAFLMDNSTLENVYYYGSIDDWCKIKMSGTYSNPMSYAESFFILEDEIWTEVLELDISKNITEIGDYQFYGFDKLSNVSIANTVETIGKYAFAYALALGQITIPKSVTSIGQNCFTACSSLTSITLPFVGNMIEGTTNTQFSYIFGTVPTTLKEVKVTNDQLINNYAFDNCTSITKVTLENVKILGSYVFNGCTSLTTLYIDDTIEKIGVSAFNNCSALKYNSYNKGYYIGNEDNQFIVLAKVTGTDITSCLINASTRIIMNNTFAGCTLLESIIIPNRVIQIGEYAFSNCSLINEIILPESLRYIEKYAFKGCSSITSLIVPNSVEYIGEGALNGFASLESLTIPFVGGSRKSSANKDTYMYPFGYIFGTSSYTGGSNTGQDYKTSMASESSWNTNAYWGYIPQSLKKVTITDGQLNYGAFQNCINLTDIIVSNNTNRIEKYALYNIKADFYYEGSLDEFLNVSLNSNYGNPIVSANNCYYLDENDIYVSIFDLEELIIPDTLTKIIDNQFYKLTNLKVVYIPETVESIGVGAFNGCSSLETITIPFVGDKKKYQANNDTYLYPLGYIFGTSSYTGSTLTKQTYLTTGNSTSGWSNTTNNYYIPDSLKEIIVLDGGINYGAFQNCGFIEKIEIPIETLVIGTYSFQNCSNLKRLNSDVDGVFNIPESVTVIKQYAFDNCQDANSIILGENVETIDNYAFRNCINVDKFNSENVGEMNIYESVKVIGIDTFKGMGLINKVNLTEDVTNIGMGAFSGFASLESIVIPFVGDTTNKDSYRYPLGYIFGKSSYTGGLATSQTYLGEKASETTWYSVTETYYIPNSLIEVKILGGEINYGAFYNCTNIEKIEILTEMPTIMKYVFYNCNSLKKLNSDVDGVFNIPDETTKISTGAFYNCDGCTSILISENVEWIYENAFEKCDNLSIKCVSESKPDSWSENWNVSNLPVEWGYKE